MGHCKTGPKGLPACGATPSYTHSGETLRGPGPLSPLRSGRLIYELLKHLLTDWLGVSTVELCRWKKRDLGGTLRYVRGQKWRGGARDLLLPTLPGKWRAPPCLPPVPTPMTSDSGQTAIELGARSLFPTTRPAPCTVGDALCCPLLFL